MDYNNTAFASESARRALQSQYHGLSLQEVLVDLARYLVTLLFTLAGTEYMFSRFVINVPPQELESMERVFWQVEQA